MHRRSDTFRFCDHGRTHLWRDRKGAEGANEQFLGNCSEISQAKDREGILFFMDVYSSILPFCLSFRRSNPLDLAFFYSFGAIGRKLLFPLLIYRRFFYV